MSRQHLFLSQPVICSFHEEQFDWSRTENTSDIEAETLAVTLSGSDIEASHIYVTQTADDLNVSITILPVVTADVC